MFISLDLKLLERNDLTSNEKIIVALISSYSEFPQNHALISRLTGISRPTIVKCMQNLTDKKIIVATANHYYTCVCYRNTQLKYIPKLKRFQDLTLKTKYEPQKSDNLDPELIALLNSAYQPKR